MPDTPRQIPGTGTPPVIPVGTHTPAPQSESESVSSLKGVERKLQDKKVLDYEQRINLQDLSVIPITMPPDYSLIRPPKADIDSSNKKRKRKATHVQILSRYWDNRAELHQFGREAQWLHKRLVSGQHKTRLVLPGNIKPTGIHQSITSEIVWEGVVERWLNMSASERASTLEQRLSHVIISEDDERKDLRGQSGVVAAKDLKPFTILGPYVGRYCHGGDVAEESARHGANVGRYAVDCSLDNLRLDVCGYGYGNVTVCINANTTYRDDETPRSANTFFMLVVYRGWPYVFVVSDRDIAKGQDVLIDYGRYYWLGY